MRGEITDSIRIGSFEHMAGTLNSDGFVQNVFERRVFNKTVDEVQITIYHCTGT